MDPLLRWMLVSADTFGNHCDGQHCGLKLATGKVKVFFYPPTHSWGRDSGCEMHLHMQGGFHPAGGSSFHTTFLRRSFAVKISGRVDTFASFLLLLHMLLWKYIFLI